MFDVIFALVLFGSHIKNVVGEDQNQLVCLAQTVYHESRGESLAGQIAVANVVMNRVDNEKFPDTVCKVVFQRKQFTWTKYQSKRNFDPSSMKVARRVYYNIVKDNTNGALFFHSGKNTNPKRKMKKIGNHYFYKHY